MNNFELIKPHLKFDSKDHFYHLQILKRKKENPELGSNSHVVKTYYVTSIEKLERDMPEIILLCDFHNARAYINLNRRSFEAMSFQALKKTTDQIFNRDFYSVRKAYESVCGGINNEPSSTKTWVVDVDTKSPKELAIIINVIRFCEPDSGNHKILFDIPTKNGVHLISRPFNMKQFTDSCRGLAEQGQLTEVPDVQKNNPTILYMNV